MKHRIAPVVLVVAAIGACTGAGIPDTPRARLMALPVTDMLGGATTRPIATMDAFRFVAGNASEELKALFTFGNQMFTTNWLPTPGPQPTTDGLGPLFNRDSCFECHLENGRGAPPRGPTQRLETSLVRVSIPGADARGGPNPVPIYGDQI